MARLILPYQQVFDLNGSPLPGAKMYFYASGTVTPKDTYSDEALTIANTNPVIADSQGQFGDIFLSGEYSCKLTDSIGVTQPDYPAEIAAVLDAVASVLLTGNQTIAGVKTFTDRLAIKSDEPTFEIEENDWTANNRLYQTVAASGQYIQRLANDDRDSFTNFIEVSRTDNVVDSVNLISGGSMTLAASGVTINDSGDTALTSNSSITITATDAIDLISTTFTHNGTGVFQPTWTFPTQVGSDLNITGTQRPAITGLNSTDIAYIDEFNDELRTYRWDIGTQTWSQVGSVLSTPTGTQTPGITALNSTDVACYTTTGYLRTYRWDSVAETWSQVGSELFVFAGGGAAITALNSTDIAVALDDSQLYVYRFNGSIWAQVGSGFSTPGDDGPAITTLTSTDIAYIGNNFDRLITYRWDSGTETWSQVGSAFDMPAATELWSGIAALNSTDIALAYATIAGGIIETYRFNGSTWSQIGSSVALATDSPSITALNGTDIAYIDEFNDDLRTYRFGFSIGSPYSP